MKNKMIKNKIIKKGCLLLVFVLTVAWGVSGMTAIRTEAKTKKSFEELDKNNETLPRDYSDDELYGLPELTDGEQKDFHTLMLRITKTGTNEVRLAWNMVEGADGYELYGARCNANGKRYKVTQITDLGAPTLTAWMCTGLKKNTYYKFVVRAYQIKNGSKTYLARSRAAHAPTDGGAYGYIQSVDVEKSKVIMTAGGSARIRPIVDMSGLRQNFHNTLRYETSDAAVVTVDENGRVKAVKKGRAVIFVYAPGGAYAMVTVVVK